MKTESEINGLLGEFGNVVADDFGIFLKRCWEHVGGEEQDLHDFDCCLHRTAVEALIGDDYVSCDDMANAIRNLSDRAEEIVNTAAYEIGKLGAKS